MILNVTELSVYLVGNEVKVIFFFYPLSSLMCGTNKRTLWTFTQIATISDRHNAYSENYIFHVRYY